MEVNEMILAAADVTPEHREDKLEVPDGTALPDNMGTLILDATCSPSNIRYPQDFSLLNEAREHLEGMIDYFNDTYHPWAKPGPIGKFTQEGLSEAGRGHKRRSAAVSECRFGGSYSILPGYALYRTIPCGRRQASGQVSVKLYQTIQKLYEQQEYMYDHKTHRIEHRLSVCVSPI